MMCLLINLHYLLRYTCVVNNIYVKVYEIHNSSQNHAYTSSYFYSIVLTYTFIGMVRNKLMYYRMSICSIFYTVVAIHSTVYKIIRLVTTALLIYA